MRTLSFEKYEGLGNDFVIVEGPEALLSIDEVIALCDRHRGIGADGVLFVEQGSDGSGALPSMRVINADGSRAEMCGNGLRCVALHLVRRGALEPAFEVDTDAGPHACRVLEVRGAEGRIEVAMRPASLRPEEVPVRREGPMIDVEVATLGMPVHLTAVSMGNPHAVLFDEVGAARLRLGPAIQELPLFPQKANVGFARLLEEPGAEGARVMELHVYERGAGWTQACGTGACAAVVAAVETRRAMRGEPIEVRLPGGSLEIVVGAPGERIRMTGPARHVFSGTLQLRPR